MQQTDLKHAPTYGQFKKKKEADRKKKAAAEAARKKAEEEAKLAEEKSRKAKEDGQVPLKDHPDYAKYFKVGPRRGLIN